MATIADISRQELSVNQLNAIECLASGKNDQETAEATGVSRQTVNGWKNHHPAFMAALNTRRAEVWDVAGDRLRALLPKALDALEGSLSGVEPDWRAAAKVIELAGLDRQWDGKSNLGPVSFGPTDPEAIVDAEVRRRRPDALRELLDGGAVTDAERRSVLRELSTKVQD